MVAKWEKEWQDKQAKEASEVRALMSIVPGQLLTYATQYFSGILLSAFE